VLLGSETLVLRHLLNGVCSRLAQALHGSHGALAGASRQTLPDLRFLQLLLSRLTSFNTFFSRSATSALDLRAATCSAHLCRNSR
jgi:hypothetical protein